MAGNKNIIKSDDVEMMGAKVEKVDPAAGRKFGSRIYKGVVVGEETVEIKKTEFQETAAEPASEAEEKEISVDKSFDEEGNLTGLVIHFKCGEVIELEFTRD